MPYPYKKVEFTINGVVICKITVSENSKPEGAKEENLHLFGPEALDFIYRNPNNVINAVGADNFELTGPMSVLMYCAPRIIRHIYGYEYGDYRTMIQAWTKQYGIMYLMYLHEVQT